MILALIPTLALASAAPWQPNTGQLVLEHPGAPPLQVGSDLLTGDQDEFVGEPQWVRDAVGRLHVVYLASHVVPGPDNLGNRQRWDQLLYHHVLDSGQWEQVGVHEPVGVYVDSYRLVSQRGRTELIYLGFGYVPGEMGELGPGLCDLFLVDLRHPGRRQGLLTEHPRLLHGFDAAYGPDSALHLVYSPWPGNGPAQPLWHMRRDKRGWSLPRVLPPGKGQTADPRLVVEGRELWVFGGRFGWNEADYRARWVDGVWTTASP